MQSSISNYIRSFKRQFRLSLHKLVTCLLCFVTAGGPEENDGGHTHGWAVITNPLQCGVLRQKR